MMSRIHILIGISDSYFLFLSFLGGDQENDPWGNNIDKSSKQMDGWNSQPASGMKLLMWKKT